LVDFFIKTNGYYTQQKYYRKTIECKKKSSELNLGEGGSIEEKTKIKHE